MHTHNQLSSKSVSIQIPIIQITLRVSKSADSISHTEWASDKYTGQL